MSGGKPVPVEGTALPLWGLEIDPDRAKEDFRAFNARDNGKVGCVWPYQALFMDKISTHHIYFSV